MNISIVYNGETFSFNLAEELRITEVTTRDAIKNQPTHYALLAMLHKKMINEVDDLQRQADKQYAIAFDKAGQNNPANKCKYIAEKDVLYQKILKKLLKYRGYKNDLEVCVRAFEQRKDLLQTLSANQRKEQ